MRRIFQAVCVLAVCAGPGARAEAKPLPAGLKITVVQGRLMITQGGVTLPYDKLTTYGDGPTAELEDDGTITVQVYRCNMNDGPMTVTLGSITALFENTAGMALHLKKQYAEAIPHFAAAAAASPDEPVYATNLLSAQSMGGKLADADATIQRYAPKAPGWFGWRLAVDSDLVALRGRPSTAALRVAKPGTVTYARLGIAYSPLGLAAAGVTDTPEGIDSPTTESLSVIDVVSGAEIIRVPIVKRQTKAADAVLAQLGFTPVPTHKADTAIVGTVGATVLTLDRSVGQKDCMKTYSTVLSAAPATPAP